MTPIEEELRAAFARHEQEAPAAGPVRTKIDLAWVRAKRRRVVRRVTGVAAAMVIFSAPMPVVMEKWHHQEHPPTVSGLTGLTGQTAAPATGPLDLLLIGSDNRVSWDDPENRHADTVMIVHVPADRSRAYLVSLPRDGEIKLPSGVRAKLSETLLEGGPALTEKVVSGLTGVTFDATVTIDFRALRAMTDAVGGVDICLPAPISGVQNDKAFPKGCQHLGADDVTPLLRARYRLQNGSYDRDRNAQRFLRSLATKLVSDGTITDPVRLRAVLAAGKDGIEIDGDVGGLLGAAGAMGSAEVVGIGGNTFDALGSGRERIFFKVGPELWAAVRDDRLADWTAANPSYLLQ